MRIIGEEFRRSIIVAKLVAEIMKSSLGPKGLYKMIVGDAGVVFLTKRGSVITRRLEVEHPIAKIIIEAARTVLNEVGDGSKSTMILIGEILSKYEFLLKKNIHPIILAEACIDAMSKCIELLNDMAVTVDPMLRETLRDIINTVSNGRFSFGGEQHLVDVITDAIYKSVEKEESEYELDPENIILKKRVGGSSSETELIDGVAFFREIAHPDMPKHVEDAKIALIKGEFRAPMNKTSSRGITRYYEPKVIIERPEQQRTLQDSILNIFYEEVNKLVDLGVNVIFIEKGLAHRAAGILARRGILAVRRFHPDELSKIAEVVGAKLVTGIKELTQDDLGYAKTVEERKLVNQHWIFIQGTTNPHVVTILIRGPTENILDEIEHTIEDVIRAVKNVFVKPKITFGGGASEMEIALKLQRWARGVSGLKQYAIMGFAEALEVIPSILAESSGLDPIDAITELRAQHVKGKPCLGIDILNGKIADMDELRICEPLLVKEQVIKSVCETVSAILRIDDFIKCKKLVGPEYYERKRKKAEESGKMEQTLRDYGLEGSPRR